MPFGFLKRRKRGTPRRGRPAAAPGRGAAPRPPPGHVRGVQFTAITEDWRLRGRMQLAGRLTDALNKREAIVISDVTWGPSDGSAPMAPAPGIKSVDPYDLILVIAGEDSLPPLTEAERSALKVHKVPYDVALELPPFRIVGTVFMHPGSEPDRLLDRSNEMFTPVAEAIAKLGDVEHLGRAVSGGPAGTPDDERPCCHPERRPLQRLVVGDLVDLERGRSASVQGGRESSPA